MMLLIKEPEGLSATTKPVVVSDVSVLNVHLITLKSKANRADLLFIKFSTNKNQMYYMKRIILFQAS